MKLEAPWRLELEYCHFMGREGKSTYIASIRFLLHGTCRNCPGCSSQTFCGPVTRDWSEEYRNSPAGVMGEMSDISRRFERIRCARQELRKVEDG